MKKSIILTVPILLTTVAMPLLADSYEDNPVIMNQFIQLDTDGDGLITKAEIAAQPVLTKEMEVSVRGSFETGDFNSDGVMDWAEFSANE